MPGAATSTMGMVVIHAISQEPSQFFTNAKVPKKEILATPAAMADVRPAWMTPKTKYPYFLGMRSLDLSNLNTGRSGSSAQPSVPDAVEEQGPLLAAYVRLNLGHRCSQSGSQIVLRVGF
jgi:hypothetical protein